MCLEHFQATLLVVMASVPNAWSYIPNLHDKKCLVVAESYAKWSISGDIRNAALPGYARRQGILPLKVFVDRCIHHREHY